MPPDPKSVLPYFQLEGRLVEIVPIGSGHINDTYASLFQDGRRTQRYIHQWINHQVFKQPERLMENIQRVTSHARVKVLAAGGDPQRETLNLIPTTDDKPFYISPQGDYWRTYLFIEGARTYDQAVNLQQVYQASWAFGNFQKMLADLPGERLHETIPDFHNTPRRFAAFVRAVEQDAANRAGGVKAEIGFALARQADTAVIVDLLAAGRLPERVTHNDTKLNNVMLDDRTGEGVCVIDLDTVMPGSALYDFGDAVRIGASTAVEDEPDLSRVGLDLALFEQLARGYLEAASELLTPLEIELLPFSARLITFEQGLRFLTDYLDGDRYYKIHYPEHNLVRCRTQFKMVAEIERQLETLNAMIAGF